MKYLISCWILIMAAFAFSGCKATEQNNAEHIAPVLKGTLGTYAAPPRLENGMMDCSKLIDELKDIGANTYNFLVLADDDLEMLKHFIKKAESAGIKVWVTLLPPSESPPIWKRGSEPHGLDFETWATELATISLEHPNLIALSIDDFYTNRQLFTPEYCEAFISKAKEVNPGFLFIPCVYFKYYNSKFISQYGHLFDGVLFPYRAESTEKANLQDASRVAFEIGDIKKIFGRDIPVIIDIYATGHSKLGESTDDYVHQVLEESKSSADGILIYCHQDPVKQAGKYQIIKSFFKKIRQ